nr:type I polyketide synthase [Streptomyces sp. DH-12]
MMATPDSKLVEALRSSLKETERLRLQNRKLLDSAGEPVAIVAMACRFPGGADSAEQLWERVAGAGDRDAIGAFPTDRGWDLDALFDPDPETPGTFYAREAGFLKDIADFDAALFGVSPREAVAMDPQQRLLLETSWEAFERAGLDPTGLRGGRTGVFVGTNVHDYPEVLRDASDEIEGYVATGNAASVVSGRLSYAFGLEGPAVTVDTACSSSLVALHLAAQSLRQGECDLALAGGVTVMSTPAAFIEFSRQRGLAEDGRCKAFAGAADGTGWSEGIGMLLVERLSDARAKGHPVLAVLRGSAVNQDGASNGLTAPNGPSQQRVIRQALENARLKPSEVDAVEAHGTGTRLGDPIEAQALLATYGQGRDAQRPLWLGSVKSNIGHTQAAAGVAGVIKMVEAMRHGVLPRTLHVDEPTPQVDWTTGAVSLLVEDVTWHRAEGRPRRAGVSSFGMSGTNAHVIIEEAPELRTEPEASDAGTAAPAPGTVPWVLSGRTEAALRAQAARLLTAVAEDPASPADVGFSLASTRAHLPHRAVVVGDTREALLDGLSAVAEGRGAAGVVEGAAGEPGRVAFVFPGQGSQWQGMAVELLGCSPVFAARMAECGEALSAFTDWSLDDALHGRVDVGRVDVVQPLLFAVMVSLAAVWEDWGVRPSAVIGHSQGEIAAACVAGALSLRDAARVVALRSRAIVALAGRGGMVSVPLPVDRVREDLAGYEGRVSVAAVNGPASVVVSGDVQGLDELLTRWTEGGVRARRIAVDYASHSAHVEELKDELLQVLSPIRPRAGRIPVYSTVTGQAEDGSGFDAAYWFTNLRRTVEFETATRSLLADGYGVFVESSPHPVVSLGVQETIEDSPSAASAVTVGSLRRNDGGLDRMLLSLAELHVHGVVPDWAKVFPATARRVDLPTYAFQRERYWPTPAPRTGDVSAAGLVSAEHPLLGAAVTLAGGEGALLTGRLSLETHPWLADHVVAGRVVVPGTALLEMAIRAGDEVGCGYVEELTLEAPLVLPDADGAQVQLSVGAADASGRHAVALWSSPGGSLAGASWTRHATGVLASVPAHPHTGGGSGLGLASADTAWPPAGAEPLSLSPLYGDPGEGGDPGGFAEAGLDYGPAFRGLCEVWRRGDDLFAEVALPDAEAAEATRFGLHPALLDAALHAVALGRPPADDSDARLPFSWSGVELHASGATRVRVRLTPHGSDGVRVRVADLMGEPVASVDTLSFRPLTAGALAPTEADATTHLWQLEWEPASGITFETPSETAPGTVGNDGPIGVTEAHRCLQGADPLPPILAVRTDSATAPGLLHQHLRELLSLLQEWLTDERRAQTPLVLVTTGAHGGGVAVADAVWGLVRSAQSEHPGRFVLVEADRELSAAEVAGVVASGEPQVWVRGGEVRVPRLARVRGGGGSGRVPVFSGRGVVLVTGGTGVLGGVVARHLVAVHGVRRLVLTSRRGAAAEGAEVLREELLGLGAAEVAVVACDVADRGAVAGLLDVFAVSAVVHAAGVLDDGVVESVTAERLSAVLRPKVDGAWWLHELTVERGVELDAFVLFSAAAGVFGNAGQGAYAAANAVLDGLALHRRSLGLAGQSLAWGLWAEASGMTGHLDVADHRRLSRSGSAALSTEEALRAFDTALGHAAPLLLPVHLDLGHVRARARESGVPPLLRGLVAPPRRRSLATAEGTSGTTGEGWAALPAAEREHVILTAVRDHVASVLGHADREAVDVRRPFKDFGFDSLTAVELRNRLTNASGLRLPATLVFDHPTPAALAEHLSRMLAREPGHLPSDQTEAAPAVAAHAEEPVAIVGMSCRYPGGVRSPQQLWELVAQGGDAISVLPGDRGWDIDGMYDPDADRAGAFYTREGGFLHEVADFDAELFGISPREALAMDPQQRLLLETSWEAFERAGIAPGALRGTRTGVFAGVMYQDYATRLASVPEGVEGHLGTGNSGSVVSGRVAYTFGLEGPAVTVDTACSSSLVALHLAAQSLRTGECEMALAGGVTVMSTPGLLVEFSRQRGLAEDGRCKAFAGAADGTGFGEGVGMLVLERLSDAERNGHEVLAVIRGSAVNQDGASNGLTAPNGPAQQRVIRQALANARLTPSDVDAVEAHGTGTKLGDPIEAQALLATYGQDRDPDRPLWLGSVKSNIGHTQAAAGVAGVIKMVEAMRHGELPRTLHVDEPTPQVDWSEGAVELLTEEREWSAAGRPRRAGVSSFGVSGTNAHVILEQGPEEPEPTDAPAPDGLPVPWALSGKSVEALRAQAARLLGALTDEPVADVGFSLATTRAHLPHRAVVVGDTREALLDGLSAVAEGRGAAGVVEGAAGEPGRVAFVFPGQGSQWQGMAVELLGCSPVFAARMAECGEALSAFTDWSLDDALHGRVDTERVDVVQPLLFAVMVSLAAVWEDWGVRPSAVIGHSQGEIAAACVAGALSLRDAARVVALRSRAIVALAGRGGMVSVPLPVDRVREDLAGYEGRVSVAAVNGPASVVVSGDVQGLDALMAHWTEGGVRARRIAVDYASHSAHVEELKDELLQVLSPIEPRAGRIPVYSTVTGQAEDGSGFDAAHWFTNLRRTVEFETATRSLLADGYGVFVESSPHPVVSLGVQETIEDSPSAASAVTVGSLRRNDGGLDRMLLSLAELHVHGVVPDWARVFPAAARRVDLPTYAFQHRRYWLESGPVDGSDLAGGDTGRSVDARFWEAVEREDLEALAGALAVEDEDALTTLQEALPLLSSWRDRQDQEATVDSWRYRVVWRPHRDTTGPAADPRPWLVLVPDAPDSQGPAPAAEDPWVRAVLGALTATGREVTVLPLSPGDARRELIADRIARALAPAPGAEEPGDAAEPLYAGVLSLLSAAPDAHPEHTTLSTGLALTLAAVQALCDLAPTASTPMRLWAATRGAVSVSPSDPVRAAEQAQYWGLGKVAALEQPAVWGGLVDLPDDPAHLDARAGERLAQALAGGGEEDQFALRGAGLFVPRLVRTARPAGPRTRWRPRGTVLVTGGTGALGPHVARWLAHNGADHLVFTTRGGSDVAGARELSAELTPLGTELTFAHCDVTDRAAVRSLVDGLADRGTPVRTVIHAAALIKLDPVATGTLTDFDDVMHAKVEGARILDEIFAEDTLDAFVLFSSIAGVWGSGDHGAYAAANAHLDALAQQRRARGLTGTSIAWGVWAAVNEWNDEHVHEGVDPERVRRQGLPFLDPQLAVLGMQQSLDDDEEFVAVADVAWDRFVPVFTSVRPSPFLTEVPEVRALAEAERRGADQTDGRTGPASEFVRRLAALPAEERHRAVLDAVRAHTATALGHDSAEDVGPRRAFREAGLDSLTAVDLRNRLNKATGLRLPATVVYDHPTPLALAASVERELFGNPDATAPATDAASVTGTPAEDEPLAIVGMSCRYPGGITAPEDLWRLVADRGDAITPFPEDRGWDVDALFDPDPDHPGTSYVREGGFLERLADFDPDFFGISPREAAALDPHQRLLLETSWEAVERAGIAPDALRGSRTGVFAGANYQDYGGRLRGSEDVSEGHLLVGTASSVVSGRIAYTLGLEGPAVTVDTACSSSLVALHLAAQSLRTGECDMALAGGVAVMSTPGAFIGFSRQRGLAEDARCKAFSTDADGMSLAEGVGVLVLERLSDARAKGHTVLAVLRGSAMNQDGASNGLTAPNGPAQQRVIRQALANARLTPAEVDVVEAHGTGTKLGDPIEAQALLATYGQDRDPDRPLWLGSVKSNIGHTQAASGLAGVIKTVMAMRHGVLPATLHAAEPTPHVDWSAGAVSLLTESRAWPETGAPRRAGVSSFGMSGTNVHVLLEQAPEPEPSEPAVPTRSTGSSDETAAGTEAATVPWVVSGKSSEALRAQAARLLTALADESPADVGFSLASTRAHLPHRAVVVGDTRAGLLDALSAVAEGRGAAGVVEGVAGEPGRVAFVFPGQGSQWQGMAVELLGCSPVFAARMAECGEALSAFTDWSLEDALHGRVDVGRVDVVQPLLFAVMVSLAAVWEDWGVRPSAVIGHSQGEIAAACVAGALSLRDAARVVALRSRAIVALAGRGGMVSVPLPVDRVREDLAGYEGRVSVAAVNGPASVVVSGDVQGLDELLGRWTEGGVRARRIAVDYASHSAQVEELRDELLQVLSPIEPRAGRVPVYSTVTGVAEDGSGFDAVYWFTNLRRTVEFETATRSLLADGYGVFVESSPHPVVSLGVQETIEDSPSAASAVTVGSLRRNDGGLDRMLLSLAELHVHGVAPDWARVFPATARRVDLPTYAFQHQRYWLEPDPAPQGEVSSVGLAAAGHPLLGAAVTLAGGEGALLTGRLALDTHPWLADHALSGVALMPGTGLLELALRAGDQVGRRHVEELTLEAPMVLPEQGGLQVQVSVGEPDASGRAALDIHTRGEDAADDTPWTRHATGTLLPEPPVREPEEGTGPDAQWPPEGAVPVDTTELYARFADHGFSYGPVFHGLRAAWTHGDRLYAEVGLTGEAHAQAGAFSLHPALLDAALHAPLAVAVAEAEEQDDGGSVGGLPFSWTGVSLHATGATALRVEMAPTGQDAMSLAVADAAGSPVLRVASLVSRPMTEAGIGAPTTAGQENLFVVDWTELPLAAAAPHHRVAVLGEQARAVATALGDSGVDAHVHADLDSLAAVHAESGGGLPAYVLLPVGHVADEPGAAVLPTAQDGLADRTRDAAASALRAVQEWLADDRFADSRLVLVTRRAVPACDDVHDLAHAPLLGLVRSAQAEHPDRFLLLDIDTPANAAALVPHALTAASEAGEPVLAVRNDVLKAPRLARAAAGTRALAPPASASAWRLDTDGGTLEHLRLVAAPEAAEPLAPSTVRVAVRAAGINFRDALLALGMYPDEATLGGEGAGVVTEVGPGVTGLAVGDRVFGMFAGAFGTTAVAEAGLVARMPDHWSFAQAAAVPAVFLTAYYALHDLAQVRAGESLLVHSAAGGVGMAAVQLARHWGVEVYGTAGPAKWDAVRALGVADDHLASSRTLDFEELFRQRTGGRGVDVVLNSLAGEYADASLRLLGEDTTGPVGSRRFVEMGKTDVRDAAEIARNSPHIRYRAFDIIEAGPERISAILSDILDLFRQGVLTHLPTAVWDIRHAPAAFRHVSQARHIGKVVLTLPAAADPDGTVLITGGTGVLGRLVARHLVTTRGARRLVLASRGGPRAEGATAFAEELRALGAHVVLEACDTSEREAVARLLARIPAAHPLTAVYHAAGVLDDATITTLTPGHLERVLRAKADSALHLHELTARHHPDLAEFVLFSAAGATLGSAGQGNYAAANTFLDALARHRRARGLAGQSLAWGLWSEASGLTAHLADADLTRLGRGGVLGLATRQALDLLDLSAHAGEPHLVPVRLDLTALRRAETTPALLRGLVRGTALRRAAAAPGTPGAAGLTAAQRLAAAPAADRPRLLLDLVLENVATVLGFAGGSAVDPDRPFKEMGFDSLTAVELRNRMNIATGLRLPATLVFDHPAPGALADHLLTELFGEEETPTAPLLTELDRLESVLGSLSSGHLALPDLGPDDREDITSRIRGLLHTWNRALTDPGAAPAGTAPGGRGDEAGAPDSLGGSALAGGATAVTEQLGAASDDEIFDFIDKRFGGA